MSSFSGREGETPYLYLRGKQTYEANLNSENALGTMASIEHALHRLDRYAEDDKEHIARMEKALTDYREQLNRPFEHEERLRELCIKQQEMNRQLDLDKGERQVVADETLQKDTTADTKSEPLPTRRIAAEQAGEEVHLTLRRTTVESDELRAELARI